MLFYTITSIGIAKISFEFKWKKMYRKLLNPTKRCFLSMCSVQLTLDDETEMSNLTHLCVLVCLAWG